MPTTNTINSTPTNISDHTIGHCRAQRHSLYTCPHTEPRTHVAVAIATNPHDHTIGHCRAQRQEIYCYPHADLSPARKSGAEVEGLLVVKGPLENSSENASENEDGWTESREELERWGMQGEKVDSGSGSASTRSEGV
jgi:hypothetical protein